MELRKFIKTTIREYLNEQKLFENSKLNKLLDFEVENGNWIKYRNDFYYKIASFTKTNNKYNIKCEYVHFNGDTTKQQNPTLNPNIDCGPSEAFPHGKCSVITDPTKIKELDDLPIKTK